MDFSHHIYDDGVVAVALVFPEQKHEVASLALGWLESGSYTRQDGSAAELTNLMGGETNWFVVPHTFGCAIGRTLVHQHAAGLPYFDADGFKALVDRLVEFDNLPDAMTY